MPDWKKEISRRMVGLKLAPARESEIIEELAQHLDDRYQELLRGGASDTDAERLILTELSENELFHELQRVERKTPKEPIVTGTNRKINIVADIWNDLRFGLRMLLKRPGFTAISVITLALGIGASTAIFSAVNPVLFQPLPYPDPQHLMLIWDGQGGSRLDVTFGTYRELIARNRSFIAMAVMRPMQPTLTGVAEPERLDGQSVSADYFRVLGVRPALGRDFEAADDPPYDPNGPFVAIVSDTLWRRRFNADPTLVGRQILLNDIPVTVIGIMPTGFENVLSPQSEIWSTLRYDPALPFNGREWGHHLRLVARVRPEIDLDRASHELQEIAKAQLPDFERPQWASLQDGFIAHSLQDELTRS